MGVETPLKLQDLQDQFLTNLKTEIPSPCFLGNLQSNALSTLECFSIYRHNWRAGALKALKKVYPVCQQLVGERYFQVMTDRYIDKYPSLSPTLYDYGAYLAEYLADSPFIVDLPYLVDVARLEWTIHCVLLGFESTTFDWQALSLIPLELQGRICFHQRENSALYHSPFPIDHIWETNQVDFTGNKIINLDEGEIHLFIYRSEYDLKMDRLNPLQWSLLSLLDGNQPLGQLPTILGAEGSEQILMELPNSVKKGYITNFSL